MNAQKRDLVIGAKRVRETEGAVMLCAACDNEAAPFSCYCTSCEAKEFAEEESAN